MHPIQHPNRPIIQIKLLMMQIMHPCLAPEEIIPTMHRRRIEQLVRQIHPEREHMAADNLRRKRDGQHVREDMLDRVRVLRGQRDGRREAVVELVDFRVEEGVVEEAMSIVKQRFAHK